MTYTIKHNYIYETGHVTVKSVKDTERVEYASSGEFLIRHPGHLGITTYAFYYIHILDDAPRPDGQRHTSRPLTQQKNLPVSVRIFSPDGLEFKASHVTLDDLNRFRDLRSVSHGSWRYEASGLSDPMFVSDQGLSVTPGEAIVIIALVETVPSQSAGLLVDRTISSIGTEVYPFDLFRVGQFEANVQSNSWVTPWTGVLRLKDPDRKVVASSANSRLEFPVTLHTINKSRDAAGQIRQWSLEVETANPHGLRGAIKATVIATTRIPVALFQDRINDLIGENGSKISVYGENKNGRALGRIKILDPYSAETIDMHHLLEKVIKNTTQDPGVETSSIEPNVAYNFTNKNESLGNGLSLDVSSLKVDAIKITLGSSQHIQPPVPAVTVELDVQGKCDVNLGDFTLASVSVNNNRITLENGAKLDSSGNVVTVSWMTDDPIDLEINWAAAVVAGVLTGGLAALGIAGLTEFIQHEVNDAMTNKFRSIIEDAILQAPRTMAMLLGANFTLTSLRVDNDAIVIDYVAPIEPDPKHGQIYTGVIGRSVNKFGPGRWQFFPRSLGNTWATDNLSKIDHIVVVMMENRSFDHVLGYRAALPNAKGENGLSTELRDFLKMQGFPIRPLSESAIVPDAANLKTRFPVSVGHKLPDVAQQLSKRLQTPAGQSINSPQGFVENFAPNIGDSGLVTEDVLGYYADSDLTFYRFLAENYSYCERYFSAHPGPTLPNRMYSLAGDVQYDRVGEAILDNNNADNFALSRALNIFDLLTRKNIGWRVYESFPSVTMLRMFARYAPDNTNIVPIARLERDIAAFTLPAVTFIDPAMHSAPENDDHPVADMFDGQIFIKRVYDALRSNEVVWRKTLLIISYDEHGGFYDHVVPPVADALSMPLVATDGGASGPPAPFKTDMTIPYGVRVPTFVISPWVPAGKGPDVTLDHCSILKTILARFCGTEKPFLSDRVHASCTFESFLTQTEPRLNQVLPSPTLPSQFSPRRLPGTRAIVTKPLSRKAMGKGDVEFHDLTGMLARMLGRH